MEFYVDVIHPTSLKTERLKLERSFSWTEATNRSAKFQLEIADSLAAKKFQCGRIIKVYRGKELVFTGVITSKSFSASKHTVSGIDLNGILSRRFIYNYLPSEREGSAEIKYHLDGYALVGDVVLDADTYLEPSITSMQWSWFNDTIDKFLTFISESCLSVDQSVYGFNWWIDCNGYVHFSPEGSGKVWTDLPIRNIVYQQDIDHIVNNMTYIGKSFYDVPGDQDSWTEQSADGWEVIYASDSGSTGNLLTDTTHIKTGLKSLQFQVYGCKYWEITFKKNLQNNSNYLNLEKMSLLHFWLYTTDVWADAKQIIIYDLNGNTATKNLSISSGWNEYNFTWADFTYGTFDITQISYISFHFHDSLVSCTGSVYEGGWIDNFYISIDEQKETVSDSTSISTYGKWESVEVKNEINTASYLQTLATNAIQYLKDPNDNFNFSLANYWKIKPNDSVEFAFEGEDWKEPVSSVQHYLNNDGSETTKIFLGRKPIEIEDVIAKMKEQQRIALRNRDSEFVVKA